MNSYFATIGLKLSNTLPPPTSCGHGITCADKGETDTPRLTDAYVSKSLVADKIKALKTRKSTGPDNIPPKLLKLAGDAIVPSLLSLFRLSITTGRVFTSWKTARLTPVYKKDDETDCCNYRPISLLSVPSKILESVVNDTIVRHVYKANNLVTDKQWVYRAGFSTELLLTQLTETWREDVDAGFRDDTDLFWNSSRVRFGADTFHSFHERSSVLCLFRIRLHVADDTTVTT